MTVYSNIEPRFILLERRSLACQRWTAWGTSAFTLSCWASQSESLASLPWSMECTKGTGKGCLPYPKSMRKCFRSLHPWRTLSFSAPFREGERLRLPHQGIFLAKRRALYLSWSLIRTIRAWRAHPDATHVQLEYPQNLSSRGRQSKLRWRPCCGTGARNSQAASQYFPRSHARKGSCLYQYTGPQSSASPAAWAHPQS